MSEAFDALLGGSSCPFGGCLGSLWVRPGAPNKKDGDLNPHWAFRFRRAASWNPHGALSGRFLEPLSPCQGHSGPLSGLLLCISGVRRGLGIPSEARRHLGVWHQRRSPLGAIRFCRGPGRKARVSLWAVLRRHWGRVDARWRLSRTKSEYLARSERPAWRNPSRFRAI